MPDLESIPLAAGSLPFLGHGMRLLADPLRFIAALPAHGRLCRIQVGSMSIVIVSDPELTRTVLLDDKTFDRGGPLYDRSREFAGDGIGTCPHRAHRRQRRLCRPSFRPDRLHGYADLMVTAIDDVLRHWSDGQVTDISSEMSRLTVRVAVRTMFSTALAEGLIEQIADDSAVLANTMFRRMVLPPSVNRLPTPGNRRYYQARSRMRGVAAQLIAQRRADNHDLGDLLSTLIAARDTASFGGRASFTDEELVDQVFTFLFAGAETSASTLAWALYLISRNPEVEKQIHAEVDNVLNGATARYADLPNLPVVNRIITETLRLYPAGWLLTRVVSTDTTLGGVRLPANTTVALSPHLIHRRADIYADPDEFVPDRWIDHTPDTFTYLPFGAGARRCIGDRFGLIETGLALATITARWRLATDSTKPVAPSLKHLPAPRKLRLRTVQRQTVTATTGSRSIAHVAESR
ncbi:cytochrome P450 [Nocardia brasiliensis]|uniref:cytochrome P450 n=1 Tax=Nocardia brasiliensis TaxID=37326 RepID=UPI00245382EC|nr:cytochrome P450 [Nocardia brasiliensis]